MSNVHRYVLFQKYKKKVCLKKNSSMVWLITEIRRKMKWDALSIVAAKPMSVQSGEKGPSSPRGDSHHPHPSVLWGPSTEWQAAPSAWRWAGWNPGSENDSEQRGLPPSLDLRTENPPRRPVCAHRLCSQIRGPRGSASREPGTQTPPHFPSWLSGQTTSTPSIGEVSALQSPGRALPLEQDVVPMRPGSLGWGCHQWMVKGRALGTGPPLHVGLCPATYEPDCALLTLSYNVMIRSPPL